MTVDVILKKDMNEVFEDYKNKLVAFNAANGMVTISDVTFCPISKIGDLLLNYDLQDKKTIIFAVFRITSKLSIREKRALKGIAKTDYDGFKILLNNGKKGTDISFIRESIFNELS